MLTLARAVEVLVGASRVWVPCLIGVSNSLSLDPASSCTAL